MINQQTPQQPQEGKSHHEGQLRTHNLVLKPALITALPDRPNLTCVDLGCGRGEITQLVHERRPTWTLKAGDLSGSDLEAARSQLQGVAEVLAIDFRTTLPLADASTDVVFAVCALMWLNDEQLLAAAYEIQRILKPGGSMIVVDVHPDWQAKKLPDGAPPLDGRTTLISDSWRDQKIQVFWRGQSTYQDIFTRAGFDCRLETVVIPPNLNLEQRYEAAVGQPLYLLAHATKPDHNTAS